jgi:Flp pilus assembly protein TadG
MTDPASLLTRTDNRRLKTLFVADGSEGDRGAMALEWAILAVVLIVLLLVVVAFGRVTSSRQLVDDAAASGGRAATLASTPAQADEDARTAVAETLTQAGLACQSTDVAVDTSAFRPGGQVVLTVTCTAALTHLALTGLPGSVRLTSTSRTPLEQFRELGRNP